MPTSQLDDLFRQVESRIAGARQAAAEEIDDAVRWAVALPVWTERMARALSFPGGPPALQQLVERRICEKREDEGYAVYWVPRATRTDLLGRASLAAEVREICRCIAAELDRSDSGPLPPATRLWLALVREGTPAETLRRAVHALLPEPSAGAPAVSRLEIDGRLAEALGLVRSATELEPIFGVSPPGALRLAIEECTRRTECFQLVQEDERRLVNYVVREEQVQAFLEFANAASGGPWALHFAGKGGLGKTMLARHLCARVIPSRNEVWARVDFDHLDPAYPSRQPWLLLDQLGEQLRLQDPDGRVTKEMDFFDQRRLSVRELASEASWQQIQGHPLWQDLVQAFARALVAFDRRIYLVFDTCEELAKIELGDLPPNVAATFGVLEALHQLCEPMRVVFFGRRPLASQGAGWKLRDAPAWLPNRPSLALHEVRPFRDVEAAACFERISGSRRADLLLAVLERSREIPEQSRFEGRGAATSAEERFSPFDVALYGQWVKQDKAIDAAAIRSADGDRYVEMRVIDRTRDPFVQRMLPTVAMLGRFDRALIDDALPPAEGEDRDRTFRSLTAFDWIGLDLGFYAPTGGLQKRMERFFETRHQRTAEKARAGAVEALLHRTASADVARTPRFLYLRLATLLARDPDRLWAWWRQIEDRIVEYSGFLAAEAIEELCTRLLGEEGSLTAAAGTPVARVRARVFAMLACARLHRRVDAAEAWQAVLDLNPSEPLLVQRAQLGLGAKRTGKPAWQVPEKSTGWGREVGPAYVAALEVVLEEAEQRGSAPELPTEEDMGRLEAQLAPDLPLCAFACSLAARRAALAGDGKGATSWMQKAIRVDLPPGARQIWPDWIAPDDLNARLGLEGVRVLHGRARTPEIVEATVAPALGRALRGESRQDIDLDRFVSAYIQLLGAYQPSAGTIAEMEKLPRVRSAWSQPTCLAHTEVPPSYVSRGAVLAEGGRYRDAVRELRSGTSQEENVALTTVGRRLESAARWRLARLFRDDDEGRSLPGPQFLASFGFTPEEVTEFWPLYLMGRDASEAFSGADQPESRLLSPEEAHARWRGLSLTTEPVARLALDWAGPAVFSRKAEDSAAGIALDLDRLEGILLGSKLKVRLPPMEAGSTDPVARIAHLSPHPAARLRLRALALELVDGPAVLEPWMESLGLRRVAWLAMDEGELLARRLPDQAKPLLRLAADLCDRANDAFGSVLARLLDPVSPSQPAEWDERGDALRARIGAGDLDLSEMPGLYRILHDALVVSGSWTPVAPLPPTAADGGPMWLEPARPKSSGPVRAAVTAAVHKVVEVFSPARSSPERSKPAFEVAQWTRRGLGVQVTHDGKSSRTLIEPTSPYADLASILGNRLPSRRQLGTGRVEFSVRGGAASVCWEAVLAAVRPDGPTDFRRLAAAQYSDNALRRVAPEACGLLAPSHGRAGLPFEDLRELDVPLSGRSRRLDARDFLSGDTDVELLHVLGQPVRTPTGLRLELFAHGPSQRSSRSDLIDPSSIGRAGKSLRFCLLQVPGAWRPSRTASDRLAANELRQYAAEVAATGRFSAVVCIPLLPAELGRTVAQACLRAIDEQWDVSLPQAVVAARQSVASALSASGPPEVAEETSTDLALYMPPFAQLRR